MAPLLHRAAITSILKDSKAGPVCVFSLNLMELMEVSIAFCWGCGRDNVHQRQRKHISTVQVSNLLQVGKRTNTKFSQ